MQVLAAAPTSFGAARVRVSENGFPSFLPKEIDRIRDPSARELAKRIKRIPVEVSFSGSSIMSSCVKPLRKRTDPEPIVLLHGFDRYTYPLLEDTGLETWAVDVLGWGFSDLETLPSCSVDTKREHLYQLWRSYIQKPMVLVGPSLGGAVAIDFSANHPEAVRKLVLIDVNAYAEGTGNMSKLPRVLAYAGASLLKSIPLRFYANSLAFHKVPFDTSLDWVNVGRLHCLLPWWEDATVDFMMNGGYKISSKIKQIKQKTLIIWGENDQIFNTTIASRLHTELSDSILCIIPDCGHIPHVEKPKLVADWIIEFVKGDLK